MKVTPLLAALCAFALALSAAQEKAANVFRQFDVPDDKPIAVLSGQKSGDSLALTGDGWRGLIAKGQFKASKAGESFDLKHVTRTPPSLGALPPKGAAVLFDGRNLDA